MGLPFELTVQPSEFFGILDELLAEAAGGEGPGVLDRSFDPEGVMRNHLHLEDVMFLTMRCSKIIADEFSPDHKAQFEVHLREKTGIDLTNQQVIDMWQLRQSKIEAAGGPEAFMAGHSHGHSHGHDDHDHGDHGHHH